jgi:hypothetical protein
MRLINIITDIITATALGCGCGVGIILALKGEMLYGLILLIICLIAAVMNMIRLW